MRRNSEFISPTPLQLSSEWQTGLVCVHYLNSFTVKEAMCQVLGGRHLPRPTSTYTLTVILSRSKCSKSQYFASICIIFTCADVEWLNEHTHERTREARQPQFFCQPVMPDDHMTQHVTLPWKLLLGITVHNIVPDTRTRDYKLCWAYLGAQLTICAQKMA